MGSYQRAKHSRAITGTSSTAGATTQASKVERTCVVPGSHAKRMTKDRMSAPKTARGMQRFHDRTSVMRRIYM
jgi:hypothetical protein